MKCSGNSGNNQFGGVATTRVPEIIISVLCYFHDGSMRMVSKAKPLAANAEDSSSSTAGEAEATSGVGQGAQGRLSRHRFCAPRYRSLNTRVRDFCPLGKPFCQDVSSEISCQVQPNHIQRSVRDSSCLSVGLPLGCGGYSRSDVHG